MSVDYKSIGARIKAKRRASRKTQEDMAEALFVTVGYISQLERGITKINLDTLSEICSFLSCDITELVTGSIPGHDNYLQDDFIERFQKLSPSQKQMLIEMADIILKHS